MNSMSLKLLLAEAAAPAASPGPATQTQENPQGFMIKQVLLMGMILVVGYMVLIRPQSKKAKEQAAMLKTIEPGDKVVTASGIVGTVVAVKDQTISMRSAETKLEVLKSAVSTITKRTSDSNAAD